MISHAISRLLPKFMAPDRPSGTEPQVRVMVEAPTDEEAEQVCSSLVALVERELA